MIGRLQKGRRYVSADGQVTSRLEWVDSKGHVLFDPRDGDMYEADGLAISPHRSNDLVREHRPATANRITEERVAA